MSFLDQLGRELHVGDYLVYVCSWSGKPIVAQVTKIVRKTELIVNNQVVSNSYLSVEPLRLTWTGKVMRQPARKLNKPQRAIKIDCPAELKDV